MHTSSLTCYKELAHVAKLLLLLGKEPHKPHKLFRNRAFRFGCRVCEQCMGLDCVKCELLRQGQMWRHGKKKTPLHEASMCATLIKD